MAGLVESLTQQLTHRMSDPSILVILTAVTSSSFWLFASLGITLDGVIPATITASERAKRGISDASALKLWEWMFHRAKKHFISTALLSCASYLVAAALRPDLRPILYGASFFSFSTLPYTIAILLPINKVILKAASDASKPDAKSPESGVVDKLFCEWRKYHVIRMSLAAAAWGLGMGALLLA
ncbi:hypothetical protein BJ322DRAFT_1105630 [Thelephora terrestris]|uniref:DUF1772-domain-containing protein n=1 Tax=Thelephora terrestris TaxID=56493 RepID=A0A9P6HLV2_9AGAM|nr:hypothetical protein BJ322DRAFT_1105630 [Thelephora terrestris]